MTMYGFYENSDGSVDTTTLIERPIWRIEDTNQKLIALCLSKEDAIHVAAALNTFELSEQ